MNQSRILVVGAVGQVGTELVLELRKQFGVNQVVASDVRDTDNESLKEGPFEVLDVMDKDALYAVVKKHNVRVVYQLAALLSATAEKHPEFAWDLNMVGLFNVMNMAKEGLLDRIFWPSSIAVFGPSTPRIMTPQTTICEPTSVYGISKLAGERWCEYYFNNFGVDIRGIRYPGLIGHRSLPGGGTTDYAVDIFHQALKNGSYTSFLSAKTELPMMYMEDAIRATIEITEAPAERIKVRSSYNIAAMSFTPEILAERIKNVIPDFQMNYDPDFRQKLAESWPKSIDDSEARKDWGWNERYGLDDLVNVMLKELSLGCESK